VQTLQVGQLIIVESHSNAGTKLTTQSQGKTLKEAQDYHRAYSAKFEADSQRYRDHCDRWNSQN
jgi:hypothetical protein